MNRSVGVRPWLCCCWMVVVLSCTTFTRSFVSDAFCRSGRHSSSIHGNGGASPIHHRFSLLVKNNALFAVLPTVEQLLNDPFMKQVHYGSVLTEELMRLDMPTERAADDDDDNDTANNVRRLLGESIKAQLSHSQGIRGFMVSYLTADSTPADNPRIPGILLDALLDQVKTDPHDLIPLTCMNVVMPVAMTTMHTDPELAASSAKTAERGIRVLEAIKDIPEVLWNVQAILAVATDQTMLTTTTTTSDPNLTQYWTDFFQKWGYKEDQRKDIANAMTQLLQNS